MFPQGARSGRARARLAADPTTGETAPRRVTREITGDGEKNLVDITVTAIEHRTAEATGDRRARPQRRRMHTRTTRLGGPLLPGGAEQPGGTVQQGTHELHPHSSPPAVFATSPTQTQTFFRDGMTISDVEDVIRRTVMQNRAEIATVYSVIDGVRYELTVRVGLVQHFTPLKPRG
ncbi:hypothetical protein [Streptomyces sp. SBT349]|uniref:hypothetical protein n=1 Tax=Streptomyces sp. SBT349 TaxID=1580539 RepID=UPI000A7C8059|nr:hypothetical protein [Streptomyces sp. SBT349]